MAAVLIRLADADRDRLGCPEWLPVDVWAITNREAMVLARHGYATPYLWRVALMERQTDPDVDPVPDLLAWTCLVWLGLRRAGVETDIATLEFDTDNLTHRGEDADPAPSDAPDGGSEGKASPPEPNTSDGSEPTVSDG